MTRDEMVEDFKTRLGNNYKRKTVKVALEIIENSAWVYPEDYYVEGEFIPHKWVVGAVCEALASKGFWKGICGV